jgi:LCP family protein required for cell wall assembly
LDDLVNEQPSLPPSDADAKPPRASIRVGAAGARRWPRRVLIGLNVFVAICLLATGAVYGYVRYRTGQLKTAKCPSCTAPVGAATSDGLAAMNILLIGSNTRTGLDPAEATQFGSASQVPGARSDVTMILHLDPATGSASLLSIPRDLFVSLPPHSVAGSVGKIDGALNDGPDNLIAAITNSLGIPINHYVVVNFDGFRRTIDAIGGIKMSFPTQLRDSLSGLHITQTGCQSLNGVTALEVVRARHLEYMSNGRWANDPLSDLARIRRDHTFLRIFVATAKAQVTNPVRLNALVGGLLGQVTVDSGLNLRIFAALFRHYRHLDANTVPETTLPITVVPNYHFGAGAYGDVDFPVEPLDHQVIAAWGGLPATPANPQTTAVQVVNISGISRTATTIAAGLGSLGYQITATTTRAAPASTTETVISYHPGSPGQALGLLNHLTGAVMLRADPTVADGSLTLEVGSVLAVVTPAPAPAAPAAPAANQTPTTAGGPSTTTTSIPTALRQTPSSAQDQPQSFDPTACP